VYTLQTNKWSQTTDPLFYFPL